MGKLKNYQLVVTPSCDPNAPTFEQLMQRGIKEWIKKVLASENGTGKGKSAQEASERGDGDDYCL